MTPYPFPARDFQSKAGISADGVVGQNTWRYLLGSDADTSVGKNYGGGSSSSSSSGGGSGGYKTYLPYPATAVGMATYAYSRIGDTKSSFYDYNKITPISEWCDDFVTYCAMKVGYKTESAAQALTNPNAGTQAHRDYYMAKGYTVNIKQLNAGHWGIIWSKSYTTIVAIEVNSTYKGDRNSVQKVGYYWDTYTGTYRRDDRIGDNYIRRFIKNV